ncbi:MAG: hypothetical protein CL927_04010 [Deltaproteobacteria bacterium]|nr:hypothetical protein [Deltaproteobacteria bacterium]HCH64754.1 hypothetical protein [Deltaproteobacteria bacterium]
MTGLLPYRCTPLDSAAPSVDVFFGVEAAWDGLPQRGLSEDLPRGREGSVAAQGRNDDRTGRSKKDCACEAFPRGYEPRCCTFDGEFTIRVDWSAPVGFRPWQQQDTGRPYVDMEP